MKTIAAIALEAGKPFEVHELDLEGPKLGEVLVEMEACGVCHTDVYSASGGEPWRQFPFVPGHEGCGIVREVGKDVTLLQPGDKVIPLYKSECGHCVPCRTGKTNNCDTIMPTQKLGLLMARLDSASMENKTFTTWGARHFLNSPSRLRYHLLKLQPRCLPMKFVC